MTRLEFYDKRNLDHKLPEIDIGEHLIEILFNVGPTIITLEGETPVSWQELQAFGATVGGIEEPWEYQAIHNMSVGYLLARQAGTEPLARSPVDAQNEIEGLT